MLFVLYYFSLVFLKSVGLKTDSMRTWDALGVCFGTRVQEVMSLFGYHFFVVAFFIGKRRVKERIKNFKIIIERIQYGKRANKNM